MIRGKVTLLFPFLRAFPLGNLSSENSSSVPLRYIYISFSKQHNLTHFTTQEWFSWEGGNLFDM